MSKTAINGFPIKRNSLPQYHSRFFYISLIYYCVDRFFAYDKKDLLPTICIKIYNPLYQPKITDRNKQPQHIAFTKFQNNVGRDMQGYHRGRKWTIILNITRSCLEFEMKWTGKGNGVTSQYQPIRQPFACVSIRRISTVTKLKIHNKIG